MWIMGNPRLRNGPALDIADDDENTQAVLDRKPVAGPDEGVVRRETGTPEFRLAALARLVEYTVAATVLGGFPPDELSTRELLDAQRQAEMDDRQGE